MVTGGAKHRMGRSMLVHISRTLKAVAAQQRIAVICTNYIVNTSEEHQNVTSKPAMGHAWLQIPNTRLVFENHMNGDPTLYSCALDKTTHPKKTDQSIVTFQVGNFGVK